MELSLKVKASLIAIATTALAFLSSPQAPLGKLLWPAHEVPPELAPNSAQLVGFILFTIVQAIVFGVGVAYLILGYPLVRRATASRGLAVATHFAIGWSLVNWVPHGYLHMHVGSEPGGLLAIEWGFHSTLMAAAGVMAMFFLKVLRESSMRQLARPARTVPLQSVTT